MRKRFSAFFLSLALAMSICSNAFAINSAASQQVLFNHDGSETVISQASESEKIITRTEADGALDYTITITDEGNIHTIVIAEEAIASLLVDYAWAWADEVAIKHIPGVSVIKASLRACKMIYYCNRVHTSWNTVKKG